jgi:hypothetical protein
MTSISDWNSIRSHQLFQRFFFDEVLFLASDPDPRQLETSTSVGAYAQSSTPVDAPAQSPCLNSTSIFEEKVVVLLPESPTETQQVLLNKITAACGLAQDQTHMHIGIFGQEDIPQFLGARLILSFGALTNIVPDHQAHSNGIKYIPCLPLGRLETDANAKKILWNSLKSSILA